MVRGPPIASTSYPGIAQVRAAEGAKTHDDQDFGWEEDALFGWRAITVFGGLVIVEALLVWLGVSNYGYSNGGFPWAPVFAAAVFLAMGSVPVVLLSYTEAGLAMLGASLIGFCVTILVPLNYQPGTTTLFTSGSALAPDLITFVVLLAAGVVLLSVGMARSLRVARELGDEL